MESKYIFKYLKESESNISNVEELYNTIEDILVKLEESRNKLKDADYLDLDSTLRFNYENIFSDIDSFEKSLKEFKDLLKDRLEEN